MRIEIPSDIVAPYIASNVLALILLACAWRWPRAARWLFAVVFLAASVVNALFALSQPEVYLSYAHGAMVGWYRDFIATGAFAQHPAAFVLAIAAGQFIVGVCLVFSGRWLKVGIAGGIAFLVAIAPLGVSGSAFPSTLLMATGLLLLDLRFVPWGADARDHVTQLRWRAYVGVALDRVKAA